MLVVLGIVMAVKTVTTFIAAAGVKHAFNSLSAPNITPTPKNSDILLRLDHIHGNLMSAGFIELIMILLIIGVTVLFLFIRQQPERLVSMLPTDEAEKYEGKRLERLLLLGIVAILVPIDIVIGYINANVAIDLTHIPDDPDLDFPGRGMAYNVAWIGAVVSLGAVGATLVYMVTYLWMKHKLCGSMKAVKKSSVVVGAPGVEVVPGELVSGGVGTVPLEASLMIPLGQGGAP